jgi:hypothetical protein
MPEIFKLYFSYLQKTSGWCQLALSWGTEWTLPWFSYALWFKNAEWPWGCNQQGQLPGLAVKPSSRDHPVMGGMGGEREKK